jgi:hypothetical protein
LEQKENNSSKKSSKLPDQYLIRRCHDCKKEMYAVIQETETNRQNEREEGTQFICSGCKKSIWIAGRANLLISLASGFVIFCIIFYTLMNGLFDFIYFSFESGVGSGLLSLLLLPFIALFSIGAFFNIKQGFNSLLNRHRYPLINAAKQNTKIIITLLLGLIPWLFAISLGYLNYTYFDDNEAMLIIALPLFVSPIIFAPKLGASTREVFLTCIFWLLAGFIIGWVLH